MISFDRLTVKAGEAKLKAPVLNAYGSFDGGGTSGTSVYDKEETRLHTAGQPHYGNEVVIIDGEGNEIWSHTYGGRGMDHAKMVRKTSDGGYILIGSRADEFPTSSVYQGDIALIKTDAEGNQVWSRNYGDEILYLGWGVAQTPDGGYILTGWEAKTIDDRDVIAIKTNEMEDVE